MTLTASGKSCVIALDSCRRRRSGCCHSLRCEWTRRSGRSTVFALKSWTGRTTCCWSIRIADGSSSWRSNGVDRFASRMAHGLRPDLRRGVRTRRSAAAYRKIGVAGRLRLYLYSRHPAGSFSFLRRSRDRVVNLRAFARDDAKTFIHLGCSGACACRPVIVGVRAVASHWDPAVYRASNDSTA